MIARIQDTQQRIVLHHISWEGYEAILDALGENHVRTTYNDGVLEIKTVSFGHENVGEWIGRLVFFLAIELKMKLCSGGSTTLKRALRKKGLEPDKCFWIEHESVMRGKSEWDADVDPPPDLAVEVDVTHSSLDRLEIYAALKVSETWHYDGNTFKLLILQRSGKYKRARSSRAFPKLPLKGFSEFVTRLGADDEVTLIESFTEWVRDNVVAVKTVSRSRHKGKKTRQ